MLAKYPKWCPYIRKDDGESVHIYDPIFRKNYYFFFNMSIPKYRKVYREIFKTDIDISDMVSGHFNVGQCGDTEIGCVYSKDKGRTLMHECLHAAMWGLTVAGVQVTQDNDEALAYYQEFLVKWATKK